MTSPFYQPGRQSFNSSQSVQQPQGGFGVQTVGTFGGFQAQPNFSGSIFGGQTSGGMSQQGGNPMFGGIGGLGFNPMAGSQFGMPTGGFNPYQQQQQQQQFNPYQQQQFNPYQQQQQFNPYQQQQQFNPYQQQQQFNPYQQQQQFNPYQQQQQFNPYQQQQQFNPYQQQQFNPYQQQQQFNPYQQQQQQFNPYQQQQQYGPEVSRQAELQQALARQQAGLMGQQYGQKQFDPRQNIGDTRARLPAEERITIDPIEEEYGPIQFSTSRGGVQGPANWDSMSGQQKKTWFESQGLTQEDFRKNFSEADARNVYGSSPFTGPQRSAQDILSMAVGKTPQDMQYDLNKDGKITSADALAYNRQYGQQPQQPQQPQSPNQSLDAFRNTAVQAQQQNPAYAQLQELRKQFGGNQAPTQEQLQQLHGLQRQIENDPAVRDAQNRYETNARQQQPMYGGIGGLGFNPMMGAQFGMPISNFGYYR